MAHERACRWTCHACHAGGLARHDKDASTWDLAHVIGDAHAAKDPTCQDRNGVALVQFEELPEVRSAAKRHRR